MMNLQSNQEVTSIGTRNQETQDSTASNSTERWEPTEQTNHLQEQEQVAVNFDPEVHFTAFE